MVLEGVIPLETFHLVEWHYGELADVPSFTVLKRKFASPVRNVLNVINRFFVTRNLCNTRGKR